MCWLKGAIPEAIRHVLKKLKRVYTFQVLMLCLQILRLNFIPLLRVVITPCLLRGENDSKQSDEFQASKYHPNKQISWLVIPDGICLMASSLLCKTILYMAIKAGLNFRRLLWVVFSSQQRLNRPAVHTGEWRHYPKIGWWFWLVDCPNVCIIMYNYECVFEVFRVCVFKAYFISWLRSSLIIKLQQIRLLFAWIKAKE